MGMQCCCRFLKVIVVVVNALITVLGILILVLGALVLATNYQNVSNSDGSDHKIFFRICLTIIVMGSLLMVVGLIGCCGAAYENQCLLGTFCCLMVLALALDIAAAVMIDQENEKILEENEIFVNRLFSNVRENFLGIELYQKLFRCCGKSSFRELENFNVNITAMCCSDVQNGCGEGIGKTRYNEGCLLVSKQWIEFLVDKSPIILGIAGIFETLAIVTSLGLCCFIRKGGFY